MTTSILDNDAISNEAPAKDKQSMLVTDMSWWAVSNISQHSMADVNYLPADGESKQCLNI